MKPGTAAASAVFALILLSAQFGALAFAPSAAYARVALPATIAAVPLALWPLRGRIGVWVMTMGLLANLAVILANGGLMPIEHSTVVEAVGPERASRYATGTWIHGSKDLLLEPGSGRAVALGDSLVIHTGGGGFVASPGDLVVWAGLLILAAELALSWQRKPATSPSAATKRAEGGAATSS